MVKGSNSCKVLRARGNESNYAQWTSGTGDGGGAGVAVPRRCSPATRGPPPQRRPEPITQLSHDRNLAQGKTVRSMPPARTGGLGGASASADFMAL